MPRMVFDADSADIETITADSVLDRMKLRSMSIGVVHRFFAHPLAILHSKWGTKHESAVTDL
jgi:hypothetical protein